ncbi:hypothetical protein BH18ACI1_BH18ACI1_22030 [soil metagenome]
MKFSTAEILQNSEIVAKLKQTWQDSESNVSGGHEGSFIVADDFGFLSVARWGKETWNEIILPPHQNCFVNGKDLSLRFIPIRTLARIFSKNRV